MNKYILYNEIKEELVDIGRKKRRLKRFIKEMRVFSDKKRNILNEIIDSSTFNTIDELRNHLILIIMKSLINFNINLKITS